MTVLRECKSAHASIASVRAADSRKREAPDIRGLSLRTLEGSVVRFSSSLFRGRGTGSGCFRFRFPAIELAHDIGANRPRDDLGRRCFLAFAIRTLVGAADERAFDEDVCALLDRGEDIFGEPRTEDADAVPLRLGTPLILRVFPRALRGNGKNGEF